MEDIAYKYVKARKVFSWGAFVFIRMIQAMRNRVTYQLRWYAVPIMTTKISWLFNLWVKVQLSKMKGKYLNI